MRPLKWLAAAVAVILAIVAAIGLSLPRRFQVVRDITIDAPSRDIFAVISRLREWPTWTAWTIERYPDMKVTFSGPDEGVGARQSWSGKSSGSGSIAITKAEPLEGISYDFLREGFRSTGGINFFPGPDGTLVAWHAEGDLGFNPINRFCGLVMDRMMGPDLETSLRNLKFNVEKAANTAVLPQLPESQTPGPSPPQSAEPR